MQQTTKTIQQIAESIVIAELPYVTVANRSKLPNSTGVYFVLSRDTLLYIGVTTNSFSTRWSQHHRLTQVLQFYKPVIHFYVTSESVAIELESVLIAKYSNSLLQNTPVPHIIDNNNVIEQLIERGDTKLLTELLQEIKELKLTVADLYSENIRTQELIKRRTTVV